MGKRKLHNHAFNCCDYTGFPFKGTGACYLPRWINGKMSKSGTFCNWESVLAHAMQLEQAGKMTAEEVQEVQNHILTTTGAQYVRPAPPVTELLHVKGSLTMESFHRACCAADAPINCVKITPEETFDVLVSPSADGTFAFHDYMHPPYGGGTPSRFHTTRKARGSSQRDLTVWFYASKALVPNPLASNLFKMTLYGDVLITASTRESSFLPRERYISFTKADFETAFTKRRKTKSDVAAITIKDYNKMKSEMESSLRTFEEAWKREAVRPEDISKIMRMPPQPIRRSYNGSSQSVA